MDEKLVTFAEAKGTEANQHAKKLAQEKSKKKKSKYDSYFTVKGQKVIKFTVKPNGIYNEYVGKLGTKKPESSQLKDMITVWKKDKLFVEPHELESFCESKIKQLNR
jgi:hypothetical protein